MDQAAGNVYVNLLQKTTGMAPKIYNHLNIKNEQFEIGVKTKQKIKM